MCSGANPRIDCRLYLVTDRPLCRGRDLAEVVAQAVAGGATAVQLREKHCPTREFTALARALKAMLAPNGVPLIINDRVDVAQASGADGVHLGQDDMPVAQAREILGPGAIIGLSVETMEQAREAEGMDVDYLGVSPVYNTMTKIDTAPPWGLDGLSRLRSGSTHILVGIGGVGPSNAADVIRSGADGVAVVSALCAAQSPLEAARELRNIVDRALELKEAAKV